jgi:hypothetical protein
MSAIEAFFNRLFKGSGGESRQREEQQAEEPAEYRE